MTTLDVIVDGILHGNSFILPDEFAGNPCVGVKPEKKVA